MRQFPNNRRALVFGLGTAAVTVALGACGSQAAGPVVLSTLAFPPGTATPGFVPNGSAAPTMPAMTGMPTATTASAPVAGRHGGDPELRVRTGHAVGEGGYDGHLDQSRRGAAYRRGAERQASTRRELGTGATYSFTFTRPGSVDYFCTIHPFMHGTVVVTP